MRFHPYLNTLTPEVIKDRLREFETRYRDDWRRWTVQVQWGISDSQVATLFQEILRSWNPCRGRKGGVRPSLASAVKGALPYLSALGGTCLRSLVDPSSQQRQCIAQLWDLLNPSICGSADAGGVGVSKAIMLLTKGEIGPAFDTNVCRKFKMSRVDNAPGLLRAYSMVARDLKDFEDRNDVVIDDLAQRVYPSDSIGVGRIVDMVAGPRKR